MQIEAPKCYGLISNEMKMDSTTVRDLTEEIPFELKAEGFMNFAELDMKGGSDKDNVNALSNIKRAIENRMDSILFVFKYHKLAGDWNFPEKMEKLNKLSIVAPRVLKKINKIRNLLEHQYQVPRKDQIEKAYDVAILFLAYTRNFIRKFPTEFDCYTTADDHSIKTYVSVKFEDEGIRIKLDNGEYYVEAKNPNYDE